MNQHLSKDKIFTHNHPLGSRRGRKGNRWMIDFSMLTSNMRKKKSLLSPATPISDVPPSPVTVAAPPAMSPLSDLWPAYPPRSVIGSPTDGLPPAQVAEPDRASHESRDTDIGPVDALMSLTTSNPPLGE